MQIGELAKRTGVTAKAIRYYERLGLLDEVERTAANYRCYGEADVRRLQFIIIAKGAGLTLEEIADVLNASRSHRIDCDHVLDVFEVKLAEVKARLADMQALHDALEHTVDAARRHELRAPADEYDCPLIEHAVTERRTVLAGAVSPLRGA